MTTSFQIQCRCGAVQVRVHGEPSAQFYCHCDDCQAAQGGAYVPVALYPTPAVEVVAGELRAWALKTMPRSTCIACGTRVFADPPGLGVRGINGYLLPPERFKPAMHVNCRFAVLPVRDGLPHYASLPTFFGGDGALMDW
jgi:hypothetical protein